MITFFWTVVLAVCFISVFYRRGEKPSAEPSFCKLFWMMLKALVNPPPPTPPPAPPVWVEKTVNECHRLRHEAYLRNSPPIISGDKRR
jgi:hypothetical protein